MYICMPNSESYFFGIVAHLSDCSFKQVKIILFEV
jgi:hypothetical protein